MANTPTHDLMFSKLATRYPTAGKTLGDLLAAYYAEYNSGAPIGGQAWYDRFGGALIHYGDRAQAFWTAWNPAIGG